MKRMSNLFASDQSRRPASALLRTPDDWATSQQRQYAGQWLQGNAASYDPTLFPVSQSTVTGALGCEISEPSKEQQEQAWMESRLKLPSAVASRPSPPTRALTADDRPAHMYTGSLTPVPGLLAFPRERQSVTAQQTRMALPSRPSSAQSHISGTATEKGFLATSRCVTPNESRAMERADLHKLLKSIESLLISFDEYRSLQVQLSKVEKNLSIGCAELAKNKTVEHNPSSALALAGTSFAAQHEVSGRYAKLVQKEYDALNEACAKYFKVIAKEEKSLDDFAAVTEDKIKKAQAGYERAARKGTTNARAMADAHEKYISTISALANATTAARNAHATAMAGKSHVVSLRVASTLGGIAESSFRAHCDFVRATGVTVGPLAAARNFCVSEAMPSQPPAPLAEDKRGSASTLAAEETRRYPQESNRRELAVHVERPRTETWSGGVDISARTSAPPAPAWNSHSSQDHKVRRPPSYHSMTGAQTSRSSSSDDSQAASPSSAPQQRRSELPVPSQPQPTRRVPSPMSPARQMALERLTLQSRNHHDESAEARSETSLVAPSTVIEPQTPIAATEGQYEPHDRPSPKTLRSVGDIPTLPRSTLPPALDRRRSLWEHEREQQESREREAVLERRAREAEDRLRFLEQATSPPSGHQKLGAAAGLVSSPAPKGPQDYLTLQTEEERHQKEPDHRSPTISRSPSSGTTASEMSFVARMKSRYQLEKEAERATAIRTEQQQDEQHRVMSPTSPSRPTQAGPDPRAGDGTLPRPRLPPTLSSPAPVRQFSPNFPRPGSRQLYGVRSTSYQTTLAATPRKPPPRRDVEGPYGNSTQKSQSDALEELLAQDEYNRASAIAAGGGSRSRVTFRRGSPSIVQ